MVKKFLKKIVPQSVFNLYHLGWSVGSNLYYRFPSKKLTVIAINGSKGKTTTANMVRQILEANGDKVGMISTANIVIGKTEKLNPYHMTMPGRTKLQKLIRSMVDQGCKYLILEVTSEGQVQYRHWGLNINYLVYLNLTDERQEAHGFSYQRMKQDNAKMFRTMARQNNLDRGQGQVKRLLIINRDDNEAEFYIGQYGYATKSFGKKQEYDYHLGEITEDKSGVSFRVNNSKYHIPIGGSFNGDNALAAIAVTSEIGVSQEIITKTLNNLEQIPGRFERISQGQDFEVIVDYAYEQAGIKGLLESVNKIKGPESKVWVLIGGQGGGRDKKKRPEIGKIAMENADKVIVTDDDPYEEDPISIIKDIEKGIREVSKAKDQDYFLIQDRREAIAFALRSAQPQDVVVIACKGADQLMMRKEGPIPWDDRAVVREELKALVGSR
ncbi:UDP-N-acetylmuramyl-tripeptide synthetase [Candidatus Nomurabacteria bacterium]|nr:UDP-N-acetylmuramyl-tripeptide synthetase [Candidatus Nomurabacteria bacterium]